LAQLIPEAYKARWIVHRTTLHYRDRHGEPDRIAIFRLSAEWVTFAALISRRNRRISD